MQVRDTKKNFSFTKPLYLLVSLAICCQKNDNIWYHCIMVKEVY